MLIKEIHIDFISSSSNKFPFIEAYKLFEENKQYFLKYNINTLFDIIKIAPKFTFAVYIENTFQGIIFISDWEKGSCQLSGFSKRKNSLNTILAIKKITKLLFDNYNLTSIFAETIERSAKICLLKAGFEKINENIFKLKR